MKHTCKTLSSVIMLFLMMYATGSVAQSVKEAGEISLNGSWQIGFSRKYTATVQVPGIATDATRISDEVLWYKKDIKLPAGAWTAATLQLKGARFWPQVYVNGQLIAQQAGGMAPLSFQLKHPDVRPGNTISIEIALASLKNVPQTDASYIPQADHWRSNVSSGLWDDVVLQVHGGVSITRIVPFTNYSAGRVNVKFDLSNAGSFKGKVLVQVLDNHKKILVSAMQPVSGGQGSVPFTVNGRLKSWSPGAPNLYRLKLIVSNSQGQITDQRTISFALKQFDIRDKKFYVNNQPFVAKGPTVVWHRWMRTAEGRELGYDTAWFVKNIIQRTKDLGGNYLRFHLGLPPERLLDLCDRHGLLVQYEWSFFHGMPASKESLLEQYKSWLDLAMRHPSVSLFHPYNETGGDQLKTVWAAMDVLLPQYPPVVMEDRDLIHIHKYWWSLFENLGLFYDDARVFPKAIIADEFGGNYLDEQGNPGLYTTVKETYLRFLGRNHTAAQRLAFHAEANAKVAEYWRRIGAAGFSPFCALGSSEDGNTWFLGPLKEGNPKPVWKALSSAFSPQSVSVELWDRNFVPGQNLSLPVYVFNDLDKKAVLNVRVTVEDKTGKVFYTGSFTSTVAPFSRNIRQVNVIMPAVTGEYIVKGELLNRPLTVKQRVISAWDVRVYKATVPQQIKELKVAVPADETELIRFLTSQHITVTDTSDHSAGVLLTSIKTCNRLAAGDAALSQLLQNTVAAGKAVVMLDAGDRPLGQGYPSKAGEFGPLQGVVQIADPKTNTYKLFGGISLSFKQTAEPESHLHPDRSNRELWANMPDQYTWLWNGLRGGLIVPASDMQFVGLSAKAFLAQWEARGAVGGKITGGAYYAYELQGFYEFSDQPNDRDAQKRLRDKVIFLVQDAPALANSINPQSPVTITDLANGYRQSEGGLADNLIPLASCAKNLTQTPVALIDFGTGKGKLLVSQLLTAGRLAEGFGSGGLYGLRYDEVAAQYVLNMISLAIKK